MKQLHPFQQRGAAFLAERRFAYLADEMGCGKTPQVAVGFALAGAKRALIVAPACVEEDWFETLADFTDRPPPHLFRADGKIPPQGDLIISYDMATMHRDALRRCPAWDVMACDEAHFLKNPGAGRTRALWNPIYGGRASIAMNCGAVWAVSGSPIPNHAGELWPFLRLSGADQGKYWDFVYRNCHVEETWVGDKLSRKPRSTRDPAALTALLKPLMARRMASEVLPELPPLHIDTVEVDGRNIDGRDPILPLLKSLDEAAHDHIMAAIERDDWSMSNVPHIATIRRLTGLAKATTVADLARLDLDTRSEKVVLFGLHSDVLEYLRHSLKDFHPTVLTGAESPKKRRAAIRDFQNSPRSRVAIGQSRAAGVGVTLTASNRLYNVEPAWTPADNEQVVKRVHRIGQHRTTRASYVALAQSSDVRVTAVNRVKAATAKGILTLDLTV